LKKRKEGEDGENILSYDGNILPGVAWVNR